MVGAEVVQHMSHCFPDISAERQDCRNTRRRRSREAVFQRTPVSPQKLFFILCSVLLLGGQSLAALKPKPRADPHGYFLINPVPGSCLPRRCQKAVPGSTLTPHSPCPELTGKGIPAPEKPTPGSGRDENLEEESHVRWGRGGACPGEPYFGRASLEETTQNETCFITEGLLRTVRYSKHSTWANLLVSWGACEDGAGFALLSQMGKLRHRGVTPLVGTHTASSP